MTLFMMKGDLAVGVERAGEGTVAAATGIPGRVRAGARSAGWCGASSRTFRPEGRGASPPTVPRATGSGPEEESPHTRCGLPEADYAAAWRFTWSFAIPVSFLSVASSSERVSARRRATSGWFSRCAQVARVP